MSLNAEDDWNYAQNFELQMLNFEIDACGGYEAWADYPTKKRKKAEEEGAQGVDGVALNDYNTNDHEVGSQYVNQLTLHLDNSIQDEIEFRLQGKKDLMGQKLFLVKGV